jgi:hypothetical protein
MNRSSIRSSRRPKAGRSTQNRATVVFRDFVRQLERLDLRPRSTAREGSR